LLTTSVVAFSLRESHAERWNDDGACTPLGGGSRTQNCSAERDAAQSAETIGIVTGVAALTFAGAALAQRLVLVDGHGREPQPRASAQCGVGFLALSCQGQF
jgi:hypothetical protein